MLQMVLLQLAILIGGFVLELNNLRYDASVKASLEKIESKLTGK